VQAQAPVVNPLARRYRACGLRSASMPKRIDYFRPHPWHGLEIGSDPPRIVNAYIEITPYDLVKYEIDKATGYLRVDRPRRASSQPPSLYGLIPRTYCGERVRELSPDAERGDGDPLDICVISERPINRAEVIVDARVVGGLQMVDNDEADDKIIAVLANDNIWGEATAIRDLPKVIVDRHVHYFRTYKLGVEAEEQIVKQVYDCDHALNVIQAAIDDYAERFGAEERPGSRRGMGRETRNAPMLEPRDRSCGGRMRGAHRPPAGPVGDARPDRTLCGSSAFRAPPGRGRDQHAVVAADPPASRAGADRVCRNRAFGPVVGTAT
jgi:inorganic pyrophosphatase